MQATCGRGIGEIHVTLRRTDADHALMIRGARGAVQVLARFEAHRHAAIASKYNDLLQARSAPAFDNEDTIKRAPGPERLSHRMDSREQGHYDKGNRMSELNTATAVPLLTSSEDIPDKLYFRIGEVAKLAGIKPYVLRFWETEFPSLGPKKSGTGHRLYRRKDVQLVFDIKTLLYEKRYTIEGARKHLEARGKIEPAAPAAKTPKAAKRAQAAAAPAPAKTQASFFDVPPAALDAIRRELQEIAELLK